MNTSLGYTQGHTHTNTYTDGHTFTCTQMHTWTQTHGCIHMYKDIHNYCLPWGDLPPAHLQGCHWLLALSLLKF